MTAHLTEEEQLEALKRWWNENGKSTIAAVVLAVGGYFGWESWQTSQQQQAEAASALYQDLLEAAIVEPGQSLDDAAEATANHLAATLKDSHSSSLYAAQAALILAKLSVDDGRLDEAAVELEWVLGQKPDLELRLLAQLRLARVAIAQQDYDKALSLLAAADGVELASYSSSYAEVRGDVYILQGMTDQARNEYQSALAQLEASSSRRQILEMKLNDIQPVAEVAAAQGE